MLSHVHSWSVNNLREFGDTGLKCRHLCICTNWRYKLGTRQRQGLFTSSTHSNTLRPISPRKQKGPNSPFSSICLILQVRKLRPLEEKLSQGHKHLTRWRLQLGFITLCQYPFHHLILPHALKCSGSDGFVSGGVLLSNYQHTAPLHIHVYIYLTQYSTIICVIKNNTYVLPSSFTHI